MARLAQGAQEVRGGKASSPGWVWTRSWVGDVFLQFPSSGSHQSPDMGDLMALNVLVSLPPTQGWPPVGSAKPSPSCHPLLQGLSAEIASEYG